MHDQTKSSRNRPPTANINLIIRPPSCHVWFQSPPFFKTILIPVSSGTYCGLCGKQGSLKLPRCCNRPVCDDEATYQLISHARNSCARDHSKYTICHLHNLNEHSDATCHWRDCKECREFFLPDLESYVSAGTSAFNFAEDLWEDPPRFEPTLCTRCEKVVKLNCDEYSVKGGKILCWECGGIPGL